MTSYSNQTGKVSVTEVFSPYVTWDHISPQTLKLASERGSRVHQAVADDINDDFPVVMPDEAGYVESARTFMERVDEVMMVETRLTSTTWDFTGQVDLVAHINGDKYFTLIDWKTSSIVSKSWSLQLSAYRCLVQGNTSYTISRCMAVQLRKNGTFKVNEYTNPDRDFSIFTNCLTAYRYFKPKKQDIDWESL